MKRYYHPAHGFHIAVGLEAEAMLKAGWTECGWEVKKGGDPPDDPFDPDPEGDATEYSAFKRPKLSLPKRK